MTEEKSLDEKALEEVAGGLSGEPADKMYESMFYRSHCLNCARAHKDCPYHDDKELIYRTFMGTDRLPCRS